MLYRRQAAGVDPGGILALKLQSSPHCMVGRATSQCPNNISTEVPSVYQQNGYSSPFVRDKERLSSAWRNSHHVHEVRKLIKNYILAYIKGNSTYSKWEDNQIDIIVRIFDDRLFEEATSEENYIDPNTLTRRLDELMHHYGKSRASPPVSSFVSSALMMPNTGMTFDPKVYTACPSTVNCTSYFKGSLDTNYPNEQYHSLSSKSLADWNGGPSMEMALSYPDEGTFSNRDLLIDSELSRLQMVGPVDNLSSNHSGNMMPSFHQSPSYDNNYNTIHIREQMSDSAASSGGCLNSYDGLHGTNETGFTAALNFNGTILRSSVGKYKHLSPCNQSRSNAYSNLDIPELNLDGPQQNYQMQRGLHEQQKSLVVKESDVHNVNKMESLDHETQNAKINIFSYQSQDKFLKHSEQNSGVTIQPTPGVSSSMQLPSSGGASIGYGSYNTLSNSGYTKEKSPEFCGSEAVTCAPEPAAFRSVLDYEGTLPKRLKLDPLSPTNVSGISYAGNLLAGTTKITETEAKPNCSSSQGSSETFCEAKFELAHISDEVKCDTLSAISAEKSDHCRQDTMQFQIEVKHAEIEVNHILVASSDCCAAEAEESGKLTLEGISLIDWFTADQVMEHLKSVRQSAYQGMASPERNQDSEYPVDQKKCQLCRQPELCFEMAVIYCTACLNRIDRHRTYYIVASNENIKGGSAGQIYFCNVCYLGNRGGIIQYNGFTVSKAKLMKKRHNERCFEPWVECGKCSGWQHQICSLFNNKRNTGDEAKYTCPKCYLRELESGEWKPLPCSTLFGARDLPKSKLSEHIEMRLFTHLKKEREERAKLQGKHFSEVPGAENLVVRVVSSVDRKLEVSKLFFEVFEEDKYPKGFTYKSKAILLFQNIEGADICLFGMYVQEYGSDCALPNQRYTCLSYIDSVKYFKPDIKAASGEPLRTSVYHEILIAYLDYCKNRGFTSFYIWVCPPSKREDFIFNCHPEKQKMPKKDKLREWYLAMLEKATKDDIVVHKTNLYDHFIASNSESKASITAARLPYFEGDYWPGIAEKFLNDLKETEEGKKPEKNGKIGISRRALKAVRHNASKRQRKDTLLMNKLDELIRPNKGDFMLIHLQHACNHCRHLIINGKLWSCNFCQFLLCEKCHEMEQKLEDKEKHPINSMKKHSFRFVKVNDVNADTIDEDENIQSEIFDSRISFLNLCQGNHYQYDTLRHAKYSTMMILYHICNEVATASVARCAICRSTIKGDQGKISPGNYLCESCSLREATTHSTHEPIRPASVVHCDALNGVSQHKPHSLGESLLTLLQHASECFATRCAYPCCYKMKVFFQHSRQCKTRLKGGCVHCKKMWTLLSLHAQRCDKSDCPAPRCTDLRNLYRTRSGRTELETNSR